MRVWRPADELPYGSVVSTRGDTQADSIEATIASLDSDVIAAKADVDLTLIQAALRLSPADRLDAAYRVLRDLVRIREQHAASTRR